VHSILTDTKISLLTILNTKDIFFSTQSAKNLFKEILDRLSRIQVEEQVIQSNPLNSVKEKKGDESNTVELSFRNQQPESPFMFNGILPTIVNEDNGCANRDADAVLSSTEDERNVNNQTANFKQIKELLIQSLDSESNIVLNSVKKLDTVKDNNFLKKDDVQDYTKLPNARSVWARQKLSPISMVKNNKASFMPNYKSNFNIKGSAKNLGVSDIAFESQLKPSKNNNQLTHNIIYSTSKAIPCQNTTNTLINQKYFTDNEVVFYEEKNRRRWLLQTPQISTMNKRNNMMKSNVILRKLKLKEQNAKNFEGSIYSFISKGGSNKSNSVRTSPKLKKKVEITDLLNESSISK